MRIIAGKARGRKLIPPATMETRPTLDRVKEAMFSTIQNYLLDAVVIDVFAGTGSLGLEAASRGAKEVYLVDKSAVTFPLLKENVKNLKFDDFCFPLNKDSYDVLRDLAKKGKVMDVIFIDPPYCKEMIPEAMKIIEENKMVSLLKEAINANPKDNSVVEVPVEVTKPKITKEMLSKIDGIIGSFTTSYTSSDANRSANVEIAAKTVNGTILMPGDTFSYNNTLGERTTAKGYKDGAAYVGNKVVMVTGGGICQVSTTLYRAVLRAGIMPTERHNHSMTTTYSGPSEDATVSWGSLDYQFKNPYDFPIYIQGYTSNKHVTFNVYGNVQGMDGKTYDLQTVVNETLKPSVKTVDDPNLPEGQKVVEQRPVTGYKSSGYLVTYQNGKEIDKKLIGHDVYKQKDEIIKVGTKKAEQPKQEAPKQEQPATAKPEEPKQEETQPETSQTTTIPQTSNLG